MRLVGPHRSLVLSAAFVLVTCAQTLVPSDAVAQFQTTSTAFSGRAVAVKGVVLGIPITLVDTEPVPIAGGKLEAHLVCYPNGEGCALGIPDLTNGMVTASALNATVVAQGHQSRARASVADLSLTNVAGNTITASFLQAEATARCSGGQASIEGHSELADLQINGQSVAVSGEVNQTVSLPGGGVVIINEHIASAGGDTGDMTVRALHVRIPGPIAGTDTDVIVAEAHADIKCGQKFCPAEHDFVTGGGWLTNGTRRNFAVAGGIKNGGYWGHLLYIDHARPNALRVKGTSVTHYEITGPTTRRIEGTALIDGVNGTYQVHVDDQGEPGRDDEFTLWLNGVLTATGRLDGGNLQIHTCK